MKLSRKASLILILFGLALVALSWLPGPFGVPGWFTYVGCPTNVPSGLGYSCIYVYVYDFIATLVGIAMIGTGLTTVIPLKSVANQNDF